MFVSTIYSQKKELRTAIEKAIPHGRTLKVDKGSFQEIPEENARIWKSGTYHISKE